MPEEQLQYLYVGVRDGGSEYSQIKESALPEWYSSVESGDADVLRFLGFSDAAKEMSGKLGRVERMVASSTDAEPEDGDDADPEGELTWDISWDAL